MNDFDFLSKELLELLRDEKLSRLGAELETTNVFELVGLSTQEIKHSRFLAQLLNPNSKLRPGREFLSDLILSALSHDTAAFSNPDVNDLDPFKIELESLSSIQIAIEYKNIDLLVIDRNNKFCIAIENKVLAQESEHQLKKYREIVQNDFKGFQKLFLFLTPDGRPPENDLYWIGVSYLTICDSIRRVISKKTEGETVTLLLANYLELLEKYVLNRSDLELLAQKIYMEHKSAIDFILENRRDLVSEISYILQKSIVDSVDNIKLVRVTKNVLGFVTPSMEKIAKVVPGQIGSGYLICWEVFITPNKIVLKVLLGPSEFQEKRNSVRDGLALKTGKSYKSDKWTAIKSWKISSFEEDSLAEEILPGAIENIIKHINNESGLYDSYILDLLTVLETET